MSEEKLEDIANEMEEEFNIHMGNDLELFKEMSVYREVEELLEILQDECEIYGWDYRLVLKHLNWV